jgi:hypothetical protein
MKAYEDYSDERLREGCFFCDLEAETRDHIPARVFLDKPYPQNLHVIPACKKCNNASSVDEKYVATMLEWYKAICERDGTIERIKINKILEKTPKLEDIFINSLSVKNDGNVVFIPEHDRIKRLIRKYAIGHIFSNLARRFSRILLTYRISRSMT